jgi:hypothetical protein
MQIPVFTRLASRRPPAAKRPYRRGHADLAVGWSVPAWVHHGTGRWRPCNALARTLHARRTAEVDDALRTAGAALRAAEADSPGPLDVACSAVVPSGSESSIRFLALTLHDAAGRPAGMLVTADAERGARAP